MMPIVISPARMTRIAVPFSMQGSRRSVAALLSPISPFYSSQYGEPPTGPGGVWRAMVVVEALEVISRGI